MLRSAVEPLPLRARRPLTEQEGLLADDRRTEAFAAAGSGGTAELEALAGLLGRQCATPLLTPEQPMDSHVPLPRVRALIYRIGAEAALTVAAARMGLDAEPYLSLMEEARAAEAALPEEP